MCGPIPGCGCECHRWPNVSHLIACCDAPPYRDEREDKICPKCGEVVRYDGWDHVHPNGLGIGSCR